jgi:hypothetical protein
MAQGGLGICRSEGPSATSVPGPVSQRAARASDSARGAGQRGVAAHSLARITTASSIGSVNLPVNVFCWLG